MVEYVKLSELNPPDPLLLHPLDTFKMAAILIQPLTDSLSNKRLNDTSRILTLGVRNPILINTAFLALQPKNIGTLRVRTRPWRSSTGKIFFFAGFWRKQGIRKR